MKRFILDCSKGLTEETKSKVPTIQFIHESVQDFLVKENGLGNIWPDFKDNLVGYSHDKLKQCCLNYTSPGISTRLGLDGVSLYHSSRQIGVGRSVVNAFPFLEYAVRNVLYHAEAAGNRGISQESFIQRFDLAMWTSLRNIVRNPYETLYTPGASLLYILAEANMPYLIRTHTNPLSCIDEEDKESYGCPFFAAIASKSNEALQLFWEALLESLPPSGTLRGQCNQIFQVGRSQLDMIPRFRFSFSEGRSTLSQSLEMGDLELFSVLLETGKFLPDSKDDSGRTPLSYAVSRSVGITRLLLETGNVDINSRDNSGRTPLSWAASSSARGALELLLATDAVEINSQDDFEYSPLSWAVCDSNRQNIKLLLEKSGIEVDLKDSNGRTPFSRAAQVNDVFIMKLLLQTGSVDMDSKDNVGRTPLSWVASCASPDAMQFLLKSGAVDVDSKDDNGRTPLSWAACGGRGEVINILLETGNANIGLRDNDGRSPLWWAAEAGDKSIENILAQASKTGEYSEDDDCWGDV
ncbi:ankyrin repeat domain-containing protein 50 [Ilyonectria robusta]